MSKLEHNMPLLKHTSWRVGGPAKQFFQPSSLTELQAFLLNLPATEAIFWLGLGSNLLIRDSGFNGTVISMLEISALELKDQTIIRAEAGVSCAKLARFCARNGLAGGEFWAGIPGTVGGALAMNAGCHGGETWQFLTAVETLSRDGQSHLRMPAEYQVAYREVNGPDECFIAGYFKLDTGDKDVALEKIRVLLERRAQTQPTGDHSCGSVFRNPPGDYAARLIESCGLKGFRIGGAEVSTKHANFIINADNASAREIEELINHVATAVKDKHDIELIREVKIIGEN